MQNRAFLPCFYFFQKITENLLTTISECDIIYITESDITEADRSESDKGG